LAIIEAENQLDKMGNKLAIIFLFALP
jgi:hypothetical protein